MTSSSTQIAPFSFLTAGQIRFGRGTAATAASDVTQLGTRVLLVRGRSVPAVDTIAAQLAEKGCVVTPLYAQGEPNCDDVKAATTLGREAAVDVILSIGGGSVIDLAKALAAMIPAPGTLMAPREIVGAGKPLTEPPLPHVAMPTTAGTGSEVTKNAVIGVPDAGRKVSLRSNEMLPRLAIIDPALTDGAPASVTFASGFDAVTQVIEPYLSVRANPLTDALCRSAISKGFNALATLAEQEDEKARDDIAYVSLMGGLALANAGLGAVHGLAGVIGGRFSVPHGLICARLLGPVLCLNEAEGLATGASTLRYAEIMTWMQNAFDWQSDTTFDALGDQLDALKLPRLSRWVDQGKDVQEIAREAAATSSMKSNPYVLKEDDLASAVLKAL